MLTTRDIMKQVADKLEDEHDMDVSLRTDGGLCLCSPRWTLLEAKLQRRGGRYQLIVGQEKFLKFSEEDIPKVYQYCRDKFLDVIAKHEAKVKMVQDYIEALREAGVELVPILSNGRPDNGDPSKWILQGELAGSAELKTIDHDKELPDFLPYIRLSNAVPPQLVVMIPQKIQYYFDACTQELKLPRVAFHAVYGQDPQAAAQETLKLNQQAVETLNNLSEQLNAQNTAQVASKAVIACLKATTAPLMGVDLVQTNDPEKVEVRVNFSVVATEEKARELLGQLQELQRNFEAQQYSKRCL